MYEAQCREGSALDRFGVTPHVRTVTEWLRRVTVTDVTAVVASLAVLGGVGGAVLIATALAALFVAVLVLCLAVTATIAWLLAAVGGPNLRAAWSRDTDQPVPFA